MIDRLAELLGIDEQSLISHIRFVTGDTPQMTVTRQMYEQPSPDIREYRPTGFTLLIATGMNDDFELDVHETDRAEIKSATIRFAPN